MALPLTHRLLPGSFGALCARKWGSMGTLSAVGLCLSAAITRGLQASFTRIIYTNIYISCLASESAAVQLLHSCKNKINLIFYFIFFTALTAAVHPKCRRFLWEYGF